MTAPQQSCPRCHLYLSARGCTPERCANPEGAAELERMAEADRLREAFNRAPLSGSDLDAFRAMLERAGVKFEAVETIADTTVVSVRQTDFTFDGSGKLIVVDDFDSGDRVQG